jgi:regulator of replication initiation timing
MARTHPPVDLGPIDRLEEKVKLLVAMLGRMRGEQARLAADNTQLTRDLEAARARLAEAASAGAELETLKSERDQVRERVAEMLQELEALNL